MAGGGVWIVVQDALSGPLTTRHQLSTDVSAIQKREFSITKAVDFTAKFLRNRLKPLIGRNNITENFMSQTLRPIIDGSLRSIIEDETVGPTTSIVGISQIEGEPDAIKVLIDLEPLFPVNNIRVTLLI